MNAWQKLEPRQRFLIGLAAGVLIAALVYVWIWEPLARDRQLERERIAQQQALLNWLEAIEPMANRLRAAGSEGRDLEGRSLLGLADETARAAGLAGAVVRIEPTSDNEVRVWLEDADFVSVMAWLEAFSRTRPVQVSQLQVDRAGDGGQVNIRVTLTSNA